jgi:RecJ-like exonuclease
MHESTGRAKQMSDVNPFNACDDEEPEGYPCEACGGTGLAVEGWDCEECDGTGYWDV